MTENSIDQFASWNPIGGNVFPQKIFYYYLEKPLMPTVNIVLVLNILIDFTQNF